MESSRRAAHSPPRGDSGQAEQSASYFSRKSLGNAAHQRYLDDHRTVELVSHKETVQQHHLAGVFIKIRNLGEDKTTKEHFQRFNKLVGGIVSTVLIDGRLFIEFDKARNERSAVTALHEKL